jgi:hypothetical protein
LPHAPYPSPHRNPYAYPYCMAKRLGLHP